MQTGYVLEFISNGSRSVNANGSGPRPHDARERLPAAAAVHGHPAGYSVRGSLWHPCASPSLRARGVRATPPCGGTSSASEDNEQSIRPSDGNFCFTTPMKPYPTIPVWRALHSAIGAL